MDLSNTLWLCFICAGLTCLQTLLSQRLRGRGRGFKGATSALSRLRCIKRCSDVSPEASLSGSGSQLSLLQAPMLCKEASTGAATSSFLSDCSCWSCDCTSSSSDGALPADGHVVSPVRIGCESAVCSDAGSSSSSSSSLQCDSDAESEGRRPLRSGDCSDDDERRSIGSPVQTQSSACSPRPLRPAIRLPNATSASHSKLPADCQRKKTKSVTFNPAGDIICCPPTADALSLLAAGTPSLPTTMRTRSTSCTASSTSSSFASSTGSSPRAPVVHVEAMPWARTPEEAATTTTTTTATPSPSSSAQPPTRVTASPSAPLAEARAPQQLLAPTASSRPPAPSTVLTPVAASPAAASSPHALPASASPSWRAAEDGRSSSGFLADIGAEHASALARAVEGRRRVMAALEEAKCRHAHLGRGAPLDDWPAFEPGGSGGGDSAQQYHARGQYPSAAEERPLGRLPNLPLAHRDLDMLSVGYAMPCHIPAAAAAPPPQGARRHDASSWLAAAASAPAASTSSGGVCCAMVGAAAPRAAAEAEAAVSALRHRVKGLSSSAGGLCGAGAAASTAALGGLTAADRRRLADAMAKQSLQLMGLDGARSC